MNASYSVTGRRWKMAQAEERQVLHLAQKFQLPGIVARLLVVRGLHPEQAADFLEPRLKTMLPDPLHLNDMARAVERAAHAVAHQQPIAVFGDYDVDGATSTALLLRYFRTIGHPIGYYIPDRLTEGYGPNAAAFARLASAGMRLILTVDCGTTAFAPLEAAAGLGLDVVVLDHHLSEAAMPSALAIVNPNRLDETSPHGTLAAVGVVFLFLIALTRALEDSGFFQRAPRPDLLSMLDIVALGTVADVVPLSGVNRAFVAQGLKVLAARRNIGLKALSDVARMDEKPSSYHLGFLLGPRVNAGGRVGQCDLGARLLSTDNPLEAAELAAQLDGYNQERKILEDIALQEAIAQAEQQAGEAPVLLVAASGWHPGVIGIVAGRLKERYHRPSIVVALDKGVGKGSGRSISGVHLGNLVLAARQQGYLVAGGGHAMAAGLTIEAKKISAFTDFLNDRVRQQLAATPLEPTLAIDAVAPLSAITAELATTLERLAPFGMGNAQPRFAFHDVLLLQAEPMGAQGAHLRLLLGTGSQQIPPVKAVCFRAFEGDLGQFLLERRGRRVHLAGTIQRDTWGGANKAQVFVDDAMAVEAVSASHAA
jgi:single-stranded-DNA-specific exonuclease